MKYFLTISLLLTLASITVAQPVITRGDLLSPGDDIFFNNPEFAPDPGEAGEDVLWDFSALVPDTFSLKFHVGHADTTPYASEFPAANIAFVVEEGGVMLYQYHQVTNDSWEELGSIIEGFSISTFENPRTQFEFPLTYNSQWQDDFSYTDEFVISPVIVMGEGSTVALVDGYGTLMLPHATFNDVLRVKIIEESMDSTDLGQGLSEKNVIQDTSYIWLSSSYHGPLCIYETASLERTVYLTTKDTVIVDSESEESKSFSFDPMSGSSARTEIQPGKYALQASPNPFDRILNLQFTSDQAGEMQVILRDLRGNMVYTKVVSAQSGENTLSLILPELPSGVYIVWLKSSKGADVQKLIHIGRSR